MVPEEILPAAASGYRLLLEELPAVTRLSLLDPSPSIIYISPQIEMLTGYPARDWVGDRELPLRVIHPDDRERMIQANARHADEGRAIIEEYRVVTLGGPVVWIKEVSRVIINTGGQPIASQGILLDITYQKSLERELEENVALRHGLAARLVREEEEERAHVATEIHDAAIRVMSEMNRRLDNLTGTLTDQQQIVDVRDVAEMVDGVVHRLRRLTFDLFPPIQDAESLGSGIRRLLQDVVEPTGIAAHLDDRLGEGLSAEARVVAYRIAKEALVNVQQHADARDVVIALETQDDGVLVAIEDNGTGFDPIEVLEVPAEHLGLQVMRERAEMSGGWLRVDSPIGRGTTIEFWIPSST
jgi:PAS domain S-box-containing protein